MIAMKIFVLFCGVYLASASGVERNETYYQVLHVSIRSSSSEIKKAYRQLALELHPDKLVGKKDEEIETASQRFLKVQEAYEVLSDPKMRSQYDYSLSGLDFDELQEMVPQRYTSRPFSTFVKTPFMNFYFKASFPKPKIPDLYVNIKLNFSETFQEVQKQHTFIKRRVCPTCSGKGGDCRICFLCNGSGAASHIRSSGPKQFKQMTDTTCINCDGKGCVVTEICATCSGSGYILDEENATVSIPPGIKNGHKFELHNQGHQLEEGRVGSVIVICSYTMPDGWTIIPQSNNLYYKMKVSLEEMLRGIHQNVTCPSGETISVDLDNISVKEIVYGATIVGKGLGYIDQFDERTDLIVHIEIDWGATINQEVVLEILKSASLSINDPTIELIKNILNNRLNVEEMVNDIKIADDY